MAWEDERRKRDQATAQGPAAAQPARTTSNAGWIGALCLAAVALFGLGTLVSSPSTFGIASDDETPITDIRLQVSDLDDRLTGIEDALEELRTSSDVVASRLDELEAQADNVDFDLGGIKSAVDTLCTETELCFAP